MKKLALIGHNIDYSLSPFIHNMVFEHIGVEASYNLVSLSKDELLKSRGLLEQFDGFNVTKPHKNTILTFCQENKSEFDAVNTICNKEKKFTAYNTDYYGFYRHINDEISLKGKTALVLGAGGVAEVIVPALIKSGAEVYIYNRTLSTAKSLSEQNNCNFTDNKGIMCDIVVNCTSLGLLQGEDASEGVNLDKTQLVYDTIYLDTKLLQKAKSKSITAVDGLKMLIYQAIKADEIFFDCNIEDKKELAGKIEKAIKSKK